MKSSPFPISGAYRRRVKPALLQICWTFCTTPDADKIGIATISSATSKNLCHLWEKRRFKHRQPPPQKIYEKRLELDPMSPLPARTGKTRCDARSRQRKTLEYWFYEAASPREILVALCLLMNFADLLYLINTPR